MEVLDLDSFQVLLDNDVKGPGLFAPRLGLAYRLEQGCHPRAATA
jgi:hypothetical protein